MAGVTDGPAPPIDLRSPDELAIADARERIAAYSEDWVTAPRRAHSGERLGGEARRQVLALLDRGIDEAAIRQAALAALAEEERQTIRQHRRRGWLVFGVCVAIGIFAAVNWDGRGDGQALVQVLLLGAIGLMLAHAIQMHGHRRRANLIRSATARKQIWRSAISRLFADQP